MQLSEFYISLLDASQEGYFAIVSTGIEVASLDEVVVPVDRCFALAPKPLGKLKTDFLAPYYLL